MSLISEALKKARGDTPGPSYMAAHPPPRRTVAPWLTAAVSLGVTAGVLIGVIVLRDSAPNGKAAPEGVATAGPPASGTAAPTASAMDPPTVTTADAATAAASRAPDGSREPVIGRDGATSAARAATPIPTDGHESPQAPPTSDEMSVPAQASLPPQPAPTLDTQPAAASPPAEAPAAAPPPGAGPTDGASYFRQVTLPGGAQLALGGIAWSATNPSALVNGRVLGAGEGGDDWTITAVERDKVEIEWRGMRFFLRLK